MRTDVSLIFILYRLYHEESSGEGSEELFYLTAVEIPNRIVIVSSPSRGYVALLYHVALISNENGNVPQYIQSNQIKCTG